MHPPQPLLQITGITKPFQLRFIFVSAMKLFKISHSGGDAK